MCTFTTRVHRCGHYTKSLSTPCESAKKKKEACDGDSGNSSTTGGWCSFSGCDKKAGGHREGPGKPFVNVTVHRLLNILLGSRSNGGFQNDEVDWDEYN